MIAGVFTLGKKTVEVGSITALSGHEVGHKATPLNLNEKHSV